MARAEKTARPLLRVALTGGIASGKSTVAKLFQTLGAGLIDTDQIARDIVTPGSAILTQIVGRFGPGILTPEGALARAPLRELVFRDAGARADLEAILHPAIFAEIERLSRHRREPYLLVAVPLLAETATAGDYDRVLVVDCPPEMQRLRLMQRDGSDAPAAERMLAAQASRAARLALADDVILNDDNIQHLARQVEGLHKTYLRRQGYAK